MEPGLSSRYGLHWPQVASNTYGYPQGWEPIRDMPAPPGHMWFDIPREIGGGGWGTSDGWGNGFGGNWGYGNYSGVWDEIWGRPGGWGGGGLRGPPYGGAWPGPHGRNHRGNTRFAQFGHNGYANAGMNYSGDDPVDDGMPGINLKNTVGGIGAEPGYDYIYPPEHTKIHVIYSAEPPWHNDGRYHQRAFHVPSNITTKELMQQFGCKNEDKGCNALVELAQGNDGRWYKGLVLNGGDNDMMKKSIKDIGWDTKRDGTQEDFVWCWFTSNYKNND